MKFSKRNKQNKNNNQIYELILCKQGEQIETRVTSDFATFRGEYERMNAVANASPLYQLYVNLKDQYGQFEKAVQ